MNQDCADPGFRFGYAAVTWGYVLMLIVLSLIGAAYASDIVINEVMVNPAGSDSGSEWVELYNRSEETVALGGWTLHWGTGSYTSSHSIAGALLGAGEFYVLSGDLVGGGDELADFDMGNAASDSDALQLRNASGAVEDTLIYGEGNPDAWADDIGLTADSFAPKPVSGSSLARTIDGLDTERSGEDFVILEEHTIGRSNVSAIDDPDEPDTGWLTSDCDGTDDIKLNEVMVNPDSEGGDDGHEWVELYNAGSATINLGGWSPESGKSGTYGNIITFSGSVSLTPGEHLLVGGAMVASTDIVADFDMGNAGSNADAVRLLGCDDLPADTLIYGGSNDDGWIDDDGDVASSLAPKPAEGASLARISDGYDTDECAVDWIESVEPTPGIENPESEPVECAPGWLWVKINEFMPNPDSTDTDAEWVELYNTGDEAVSLDGWALNWGTNAYSSSKVFAVGTDLGPGEFLLIGGSLVDGTDVTSGIDMGNASSNSDAVQLVDCDGYVQDTVVYGSPNDDGWLNDLDDVAVSMASKPGDGKSLARAVDGEDTERSGDDFVLSEEPTPGAANPYQEPVVCIPGESNIKINELMPNPEGSDAENEFIELYNPTLEDISLDGWGLAAHTSKWPGIPKIIFPGGVTIGAGEFIVIGGANIEEADIGMDEDPDMLGNSSKNPDGVRLVDCVGEVQDTVLYGDASKPIEDFELLDDLDGVSMAGMPRDGLSVGRTEDGVDTDDNEADFSANMPPTPGAPNGEAGGASAGEEIGSGCGCGKSGPGAGDAPTAEASAVGGALVSMLMFVGMRRRDD